MKRLFIYAAIAAAAIGSMTSCSDFLEVEPVGKMSEPDFLNQEGVSRLIPVCMPPYTTIAISKVH